MGKDKTYLGHILEAIETIEQYTADLTLEKLLAKELKGKLYRDAIVREFEIIGEATKNLTKNIKERENSVEWQEIVDMRNLLIHEYFGVIYEVVWDAIKEDLPGLKKAVTKLLG